MDEVKTATEDAKLDFITHGGISGIVLGALLKADDAALGKGKSMSEIYVQTHTDRGKPLGRQVDRIKKK